MLIQVAVLTLAAQTEERTIQIFLGERRGGGGRNTRALMALLALQLRVRPLQRVTRPIVIEGFHRRVPLHEAEVPPIVLGMTADAGPGARFAAHERRMKTALFVQTRADLGVTAQALELSRILPDVVAFHATRSALEELMRGRKRPRTDLRQRSRDAENHEQESLKQPFSRHCYGSSFRSF
jgi:hypothetical protein